MPNLQKTIQPARAKGNSLRAPKPPKDLWDFIDREREFIQPPENSITAVAYAKRYGVTYDKARHHLENLVAQGKLRMLGRWGMSNHYGK